MDYKGYHITAKVVVDEAWDFCEDSGGTVTVTTIIDRSRVDASSDIEHFAIEDPEGNRLDQCVPSPASARAFIDGFIEKNGQLVRSKCHNAAVWRTDDKEDYCCVCTICGNLCDI